MAGRTQLAPTFRDILDDSITKVAEVYWAPYNQNKKEFDVKVIELIYQNDLLHTRFNIKRTMLLEFSQYLERYLWPNYSPETSNYPYVMSVAVMVNEKFREAVPAWDCFQDNPKQFGHFFEQVMKMLLDNRNVSLLERMILLIFLDHCFNSLEVDCIRDVVQQTLLLSSWVSLHNSLLQEKLKGNEKLRKYWRGIQKKDKKLDDVELQKAQFFRTFLKNLIESYLQVVEEIPETGEISKDHVSFCERFMELMVDMIARLPTRRWFHMILQSTHMVAHSDLSALARRREGLLFNQLKEMVKFYNTFEVDDLKGTALTDRENNAIHYDRIHALQKEIFKRFPAEDHPELRRFALSNVGNVDKSAALRKALQFMQEDDLIHLAVGLHLIPESVEEGEIDAVFTKEFLVHLLVNTYSRRPPKLDQFNSQPLYPTEDLLWDENIMNTEYYTGLQCLALPKLGIQFLTLHDYLVRNYNLFRLESTYEIRLEIEDQVARMKPWCGDDGACVFGGWARMCLPLQTFSIVEVARPLLGEVRPRSVRADIVIDVDLRREMRNEWEGLKKHDIIFLLTVRPKLPYGTPFDRSVNFLHQYGVEYVRGAEVEGYLDEEGRVIEDWIEKPHFVGNQRTLRVWLDTNQYHSDMTSTLQKGNEDVYKTFNMMFRRKPKENNFKAVLETIRDLMNTKCVVPSWIQNILLGYGDPAMAHYTRMENQKRTLDFRDTFLDWHHLRASFPDYKVEIEGGEDQRHQSLDPPYLLTFPPQKPETDDEAVTISVKSYTKPNRGPYPQSQPKTNSVPFTPTQIEAIRAGMQPGLSMIVGPPGTGKTDVAVQIISNIYHNFPEQRTVIVTHSNQALNQLFEKIMHLDIDERHLLRLGHGEEMLETEKDFSRYGRVNYVLQQRLALLKEVNRMQQSLGVKGDVSYTCETAGHFYLYQVLSRWEKFEEDIKNFQEAVLEKKEEFSVAKIGNSFPFHVFFSNAAQPLFKGEDWEEDMDIANGCWWHIKNIFEQLEEFRAFELLRTGLDRTRYLLVKEAKIIAMTCTHAALKRKELVELGFKFDNIIMEESAQILEIETFIPLLLQNPEDGFNRLKRWIMIGDHHQLPPVIKNQAFQKYSNMEQSLFTRFVRLGVPIIQLDMQGRARPTICELYNWRYEKLGNLPHTSTWPEFRKANAGLVWDYQLIDVGDFNGVGESEPSPYFYQNLAEAEYIVATFMYMRLVGYPAEKISILTTYNGQKHLIRDVIENRCANNPMIGRPAKVTTVDRFQGQQNDFILLSLVRTKTVGHIRDVRRLIVAMSRARLGLYIFGRIGLFQNCFELGPSLRLLTARPTNLMVAPEETYPADRPFGKAPKERPISIPGMSAMHKLVYKMYLEKIEAMEKDKDAMLKLIADPNEEFEDEEEEVEEEQEENGEAPVADVQADVIQNEVEEPIPKKHKQPEASTEAAEQMDES